MLSLRERAQNVSIYDLRDLLGVYLESMSDIYLTIRLVFPCNNLHFALPHNPFVIAILLVYLPQTCNATTFYCDDKNGCVFSKSQIKHLE